MLQQEPQIDLAFIGFIREHRGKALGDPVGKQYCRVEFIRDSNDTRPVVFEAWVDLKKPKEALFWNGLTYPISKVLGPANLETAKKKALQPFNGGMMGFWQPYDYFISSSQAAPGPLAIWFMLGEVEVAKKLIRETLSYARNHPPTLDNALAQWLAEGHRQNFARAFTSFRDHEALRHLEMEAELAPYAPSRYGPYGLRTPAQLIPEVRRHSGKQPNPRATSKEEMIRNLEDLSGHGVWIGPGPLVLEQIAGKGADIVPELIHAYKSDTRLTRAPNPNLGSLSSVATVSNVARMCLLSSWPEVDQYPWSTEDVLQDRWKLHRDLTSGERLIAMLKDPEMTSRITGLVQSRLSKPNRQFSKPSLASKLELERLRPQLRPILKKHADDAVAYVDTPELSEWDRKRAIQDALRLTTEVSIWDFGAGRDSIRSIVKSASADWDKPGSVKPTEMLEPISVGIRNNDSEILAAYRKLCAREDRLKNWLAYSLPGLQRPVIRDAISEAKRILGNVESTVRYNSQPDQAIHIVTQFFQSYPAQNLSYPELRNFLRLALQSPAYILVEGGPYYRKVLSTGSHFSLTLPKGAPDLMRLFVRDLTAHYLCQDFNTGVDFSFFEPEEIKSKKREAIREWLSNLPNEPVKRKEPDYLRKPIPQKATWNNSNP